MTVREAKLKLQELLLIPAADRAPNIGPKTRAAFERLAAASNEATWGGTAAIDVPKLSSGRIINDAGIALVKHFESLFLKAYQDQVGVWTIGWGHTGLQHRDGTVYPGRTITEVEAGALLAYDMHQFEERVSAFVKVGISDNQFAALVSFDFNTGGLGKSTLLRALNAGDTAEAGRQFLRWNRAGGQVANGLTRRRISELRLFLSTDTNPDMARIIVPYRSGSDYASERAATLRQIA